MGNNLLNISELMKETGLSRSTLNRMRLEGMPFKEGAGTRKYDLDEVKAFIAERSEKNGVVLTVGNSYTNADIVKYFRVGNMGGMRKSNTQNALVLISKAEDPTPGHEYDDYFDDDGVLHYTGMGQEGDQKYTHGNRILGDSVTTGITVHMFMRHGSDEYIYRGIVTLAGDVYQEIEPDKNKNLRKVYKFPLQFRSTEAFKESAKKTSEVQRELEKRAKDMDIASLFDANEAIVEKIKANESLGRVRSHSQTTTTKREPKVAAYAIARADGKCQLCGTTVDSSDVHKPSRLVCHHEPPLYTDGGVDDKYHTAALCDNCHARRHSKELADSALATYIGIINAAIIESEERVKKMLLK